MVKKEQGSVLDLVEVGDLSRREINPYRRIIGLFSHHGDGQSGGKKALKQMLDKLFV